MTPLPKTFNENDLTVFVDVFLPLRSSISRFLFFSFLSSFRRLEAIRWVSTTPTEKKTVFSYLENKTKKCLRTKLKTHKSNRCEINKQNDNKNLVINAREISLRKAEELYIKNWNRSSCFSATIFSLYPENFIYAGMRRGGI